MTNDKISAEAIEKINDAVNQSVDQKLKTAMADVLMKSDMGKNREELLEEVKGIVSENAETMKTDLRDDVLDIIAKAQKANEAQKAEDRWEQSGSGDATLYTYKGALSDVYKAARNSVANKAITTNANTVGSPEVTGQIWTPMDGMNAWRQDVNVQSYENVATDTFITLRVGQLEFEQRANSGADFANDQGRGDENKHQFVNHELKATISKVAADDVPAYLGMLEVAAGMADMKNKGAVINKVVKDSVKDADADSLAMVKTGVANKYPAKADWVKKLGEMTAQIGGDYRAGCVWHFSPEAYGDAVAASDGEFAFSVSEGITRLLGYPVRINDRLDAGTGTGSNGQVGVVFGNPRYAVTLAERDNLDITWNPYFSLGNYTLYVSSRFNAVLVETGNADRKSMVGLVTGT